MKVEGIINRRLDISRRKKTFEEKDIKVLEGSNIYEGIDGILYQSYNANAGTGGHKISTVSGIVEYWCYRSFQNASLYSDKVITDDNGDIIIVEVTNND